MAAGVLDAVSQDTVGITIFGGDNRDYYSGNISGHVGVAVTSGVMMGAGGGMAVGGGAACLTGVGCSVGAPVAITGAAMVGGGYVMQQNANRNLQNAQNNYSYSSSSSNNIDKHRQSLSNIAGKCENLKCDVAAKDMKSYLLKNNLKGEQIEIRYSSKHYIVSDSYKNGSQYISENGYHTGILYEGKVYDNIHTNGIPYQQWLDDFHSTGTRSINRIKID